MRSGVIVFIVVGAWFLLSVLLAMAIGVCLRPRTRIVDGPTAYEPRVRRMARAA
jgi:hypothetical protein